jgi:hypothetical protein
MLALSSGRRGEGSAADLSGAAEDAAALGFRAVFAARPPADAARARGTMERVGVTLAGVAAEPLEAASGVRAACARAAAGAASARTRVVVVDAGDLGVPAGRTAEGEVEALARGLFEALREASGATIAVRGAGRAGRLLGLVECEWLLEALSGKAFGVWFDPVRVMRRAREEAEVAREGGGGGGGGGPATWGKAALDAAERLAARTVGVAVHGLGDGAGHAHPEDGGPDWGTLRGLLPSRAVRVLDVGPRLSDAEVRDVRRRFEETLGW